MAGNTIYVQGSYIDVHDNEVVNLNVDKAEVSLTPSLRREWGLAPLCGAAATFSGCSKTPVASPKGEGSEYLSHNDNEVPQALRCEEAEKLMEALVDEGMLDEAWQPVGLSLAERAETAMQIAQRIGLREVWQVFGTLWHTKPETLRSAFNKGREQRKILGFQDRVKKILG